MNKKKFLAIMITLIVLFSLSTAMGATDNIKVTLNNQEIQFDTEPFIEDGRTLVPIRAITEAMNFNVEWDSASSTAVIENENQSIYIQIGNKTIHSKDKSSLNEQKIQIDVPAKIYNDRTYVPLRAVSETFGAYVDWDNNLRLVTITYSPIKEVSSSSDENEIVTFNDKAFEYSVRSRVGFERNEDVYRGNLTKSILSQIHQIHLRNAPDGTKLRSIADISKLPALESIVIYDEVDYIDDLTLICGNNSQFKDPAFEMCVRINIADDYEELSGSNRFYIGDITDDMLKQVTTVSSTCLPSFVKISSLQDLSLVPNVKHLNIEGKQNITDYSPIGKIKEWKNLSLDGLIIKDDSFLDDINVTESIDFPNLGDADYGIDFTDSEGEFTYTQALDGYREASQKFERFKKLIDDSMSDYEKYKTIHDYIILNMQYDWDRYEADTYGYYFDYDAEYGYYSNILNMLFAVSKGVCNDYAEFYNKLCSYCGLECWIVDGEANGAYGWGAHSWNIVNIDGNYYHVDVTWDDPDEGDNVEYDYFLISDEQMSEDHIWDVGDELYQSEFTNESSGFMDMPVCANNYKN